LSPDFWGECNLEGHPFVEYSSLLAKTGGDSYPKVEGDNRGGGRNQRY